MADDGGSTTTITGTATVLAPNVTITKSGTGTVNSTDTVAFAVTVSNTGTGTAYGVNLTDPLPDSADLSWMIQSGDPGSISGGTLSDAIGSLASGASVTIHVSAATAAGYSATLNNTATVTASNNIPASQTATATDTVLAPSLSITKTADATPINSTDTAAYAITVANAGPGMAYNVSVSDALPDSADLSWTTSTPGATVTSGTLSDLIGTLASGGSVTIHVSAPTAAGYSATLANSASVSSSNTSPASFTASATIVVQAPSLSITKTADASPINSTDTAAYTITVSNAGPGKAYNVNVSDALPDSAHLSWTTSTPGATVTSGTLSDLIGTLASGGSVTIHVSAPTAAGYSASLANSASVNSSNTSPGSFTSSATIVVQAPSLSITKTADATPINSTDTAAYTITVANAGPGTAYNVGSSRVDLQACKLEYSIVSPK